MKALSVILSLLLFFHSFGLQRVEIEASNHDLITDYWTASNSINPFLGIFLAPEQPSFGKIFQKNDGERFQFLSFDLYQLRSQPVSAFIYSLHKEIF